MNHPSQLCFRITRLLALCAALALPAIAGCAGLYSAKAIEGTVVDVETGKPLEGVVIVAHWSLYTRLVGNEKTLLQVTEVVTDKNGRYAIAAWGPKALPAMADFREGRDPELLLFKSGYEPEAFRNPWTGLQNPLTEDTTGRRPPVGDFIWNGKPLPLKKWSGDLNEYARRLGSWKGRLPHFNPNDWRAYPRMVISLDRENKRLKLLGINYGVAAIGVFVDMLSESDQQFLRNFHDAQ